MLFEIHFGVPNSALAFPILFSNYFDFATNTEITVSRKNVLP